MLNSLCQIPQFDGVVKICVLKVIFLVNFVQLFHQNYVSKGFLFTPESMMSFDSLRSICFMATFSLVVLCTARVTSPTAPSPSTFS